MKFESHPYRKLSDSNLWTTLQN